MAKQKPIVFQLKDEKDGEIYPFYVTAKALHDLIDRMSINKHDCKDNRIALGGFTTYAFFQKDDMVIYDSLDDIKKKVQK